MIWDNFSIFRANCAIACCTRAYMLRVFFADVVRKKWRPKFPKSFMLLARNSTPLWLLEFYLNIFAVSCSSLSGDSAEFRYVPLYIADQVEFPEFRCSFYKNCTLLQSKFHIWKRLTSWICLDIGALRPNTWQLGLCLYMLFRFVCVKIQ